MGNEMMPALEGRPAKEHETSSDTDSDSEDGGPRVDNSWKNMNLKSLGIQLNFSRKEDAGILLRNRIGKWSVEKRNENWKNIPTDKGEFICSDIYEVEGPKIQTTADVTVTVTLGKDLSPKRHKVMVKRCVDGKWETADAEFQTSFGRRCKAVFKTRQIEEFVILGCVKFAKVKVSPAGAKVKVDETSKIEVDIPAGAVDKDQDIDFRIIPPDPTAIKNYLLGPNPFCKSVVGVTECLFGDSEKDLTFKKPVNVQLPVEKKSKDGETTLVLFRMVGKDVEMMKRDTMFSVSEGMCNLAVKSFSGYFAATVRQSAVNDEMAMKSDVRLLFGLNSLAKILVFRERELMAGARFPRVWVELVDKVHVNNTVKMRTEEGLVELLNSRSGDIKVKDSFKLTFEITGNIKGDKSIPKGFYLISYLEVSDDNHKIFPVEMRETGGRLGIINFYHERECVHSVQFDTQGFGQAVQYSFRPSTSVSGTAAAAGDQLSMGSGSGFASLTSIRNDGSVGGAGFQRKDSVDSIGSAKSLWSVSDECKALNDSSLFIIANKMGSDDGFKLSVQLGMADVFDNISQSSHSHRQANFKLLKDWVKSQTDVEEALKRFKEGLKTVKLFKIEKAIQKAVKNKSEVSEKDIK